MENAIFWFLPFLFQISNAYCQKCYNGFCGFYYVKNIFDLRIFNNETAAVLSRVEICTETYFVSLFFLKERNVTTSFSMIHLKYAVVQCANLNWSSSNTSFLNHRSLNKLFCFFFDFSFMFISMRLWSTNLWNNYHFFNKFPKFISRCSILQNNWMSNLVIQKWRQFKNKAKFEKKASFL